VLSVSGMKRLTFSMLTSAMTSIILNAKAMYASLDPSESVCNPIFWTVFGRIETTFLRY
jgi:hypothetical protein